MTLLMGILCLIISLSACMIANNLRAIADTLHDIELELAAIRGENK